MPIDLLKPETILSVPSKTVYFGPVSDSAIIPKYSKAGDAGMDIFSDEDVVIVSGESKTITSGVRVKIPEKTVGFVTPRSGMASKYSVTVGNAPGTIDCFSEDSLLSLPNGEKTIKEIRIGEPILSVNENGEVEIDEVSAIYDKGFQDTYKIETETGILTVTGDTLVFTSAGFKSAKDLTEEDFLLSNSF